ncbi:LacI family DNA-binding transcriptional regulator [Gelidibacter salicanalis]|uniref:LacI family DNA-binding transcriptional regulator n=1 Tax=Gelidibacter salicanalis TaxID=291193 RepID=A0A934KII0_9FLAO|nr:LacI family DNA-binding transcriptional regulator [Gelidibacter salicanalis]MBJ7880131.1 LacI family DNA-binding transcriptional regulator [Gelidibacter salicanalis]
MMTLKKISYLTDFSLSTVSKGLNNSFDISNATKKMIQDIAFEYNYTPHPLRRSKTNMIAVIISHVNHLSYGNSLFDIEKSVSKYGYRILLHQSFEKEIKVKGVFARNYRW